MNTDITRYCQIDDIREPIWADDASAIVQNLGWDLSTSVTLIMTDLNLSHPSGFSLGMSSQGTEEKFVCCHCQRPRSKIRNAERETSWLEHVSSFEPFLEVMVNVGGHSHHWCQWRGWRSIWDPLPPLWVGGLGIRFQNLLNAKVLAPISLQVRPARCLMRSCSCVGFSVMSPIVPSWSGLQSTRLLASWG